MKEHWDVVGQTKLMLELIPEWKDPARMEREREWVRAFLLGRGYSYDETEEIRDARDVYQAYRDLRERLASSARR